MGRTARGIGLLTGTFDPVHLGHVALATAARGVCGLDEVWLLVNPDPGHKVNVLSQVHRIAMAELAVEGLSGVRMAPQAVREAPHTMAGLADLMARYPDRGFVFVAGMDVMAGLDQWPDAARIVREAEFAVARRPGTDEGVITALRERLGALGPELRVRVFDLDDGVSSLQIREQLRAGKRPAGLDARVWAYTREHNLYR